VLVSSDRQRIRLERIQLYKQNHWSEKTSLLREWVVFHFWNSSPTELKSAPVDFTGGVLSSCHL